MPHCIIEHSIGIDGQSLLPLVYTAALSSALFESQGSDIKIRAIPYSNYQTGNVNIEFIHVTLKILSGRDLGQKKALSDLVLENLCSQAISNCSISVEVVDIDRGSYTKRIV